MPDLSRTGNDLPRNDGHRYDDQLTCSCGQRWIWQDRNPTVCPLAEQNHRLRRQRNQFEEVRDD